MKFFSTPLLLLALLAGCQAKPQPVHQPYTGPTDSLDVLVDRINARTDALPTLWASGSFELDLREGERSDFVNGSLLVLYRRPGQMRMVGEKLTRTLFDLGMSDGRFWLMANPPREKTVWHGSYDPSDPRPRAELPVRPDALLDVLGLEPLDTDLIDPPVPTLRFNPDYDAYMLTWHVPDGDRWVTTREVWYDRVTLEPRRVWVFDRDGRVIVRAILRDFAPVESTDASMPREAEFYFVESGSRLRMSLESVRVRRGSIPMAASFRFDPAAARADRTIDLSPAAAEVVP